MRGSDQTHTHTRRSDVDQIRRHIHITQDDVRADIYIYTDMDLQYAINMGWTDQKLHIYKRHIEKNKSK